MAQYKIKHQGKTLMLAEASNETEVNRLIGKNNNIPATATIEPATDKDVIQYGVNEMYESLIDMGYTETEAKIGARGRGHITPQEKDDQEKDSRKMRFVESLKERGYNKNQVETMVNGRNGRQNEWKDFVNRAFPREEKEEKSQKVDLSEIPRVNNSGGKINDF